MTAFFKKVNRGSYLESSYNPFDRFFRNDISAIWNANTIKTVPLVNTSEVKDAYKIEMAVPGLKKEDFNIRLEENVLTIFCEKEPVPEEDDKSIFSRREYDYTFFSRSITLPDNADGENVEANYEDGVLNLVIPKKSDRKIIIIRK